MIAYSEIESRPISEVLSEIESLYKEIFTAIDPVKFLKRIEESQKLFTVVAYDGERMIGFKMGYALDSTLFYSWIGGVLPEYRRHRIAQTLLERQHTWCTQQGFQTIRTKTMNRWKSMLILNLKNGFDIISIYTTDHGKLKIILEKSLGTKLDHSSFLQ